MKLELKNQIEKPFFDRVEYLFSLDGKANSSYEDLKNYVTEKLNSNKDLVIIKKVKHRYGRQEIQFFAYVYGSLTNLKKYESIKEDKKAEAKPSA